MQTEGTKKIWNLLASEKVAILADEVGMGKTYQALGIIALQYLINPESRILLFVPNSTLAGKWNSEYRNFIQNHYRIDKNEKTGLDDPFRSINGEAINEAYLFNNLDSFAKEATQKAYKFFIGSIHSLSVSTGNDAQLQIDFMERGHTIRENLDEALGHDGKAPFDLLIIDEAQYFRNYSTAMNSSNRVRTAIGLFGQEKTLAQKVLLMTATPNHRSNNDIINMLRYFHPLLHQHSDWFTGSSDSVDKISKTILETIAVRRLKSIQVNASVIQNKYHYRDTQILPASIEKDSIDELYFALYQRELVKTIDGNASRSSLQGYLEGFESVPDSFPNSIEDSVSFSDDVQEKEGKRDYHEARDTNILRQLIEKFKQIPEHSTFRLFHPKLELLCKTMVPESINSIERVSDLKHIVFVRRIPSVREIAYQVNMEYNEILNRELRNIPRYENLPRDVLDLMQFRKVFNDIDEAQLINSESDLPGDIEDDIDVNSEGGEEEMVTQVPALYLFSTLKDSQQQRDDGLIKSTNASRFRLLFGSTTSPFSLFFQPASDYQIGTYRTPQVARGQDRNYPLAAKIQRIQDLEESSSQNTEAELNLKLLIDNSRIADPHDMTFDNSQNQTLWGLIYPRLLDSDRALLDSFNAVEKEAFAEYLQKGFLVASPYIVSLFRLFESGNGRYSDFVQSVDDYLSSRESRGFFETWVEALQSFRTWYKKILMISTKHDLLRQNWKFFNKVAPAVNINGSTPTETRQNRIKAFNTPFFPYVIVSTSVLQEGVNLHLHCRNVVHYGLPGSSGGAEQRIGRVDRVDSHVERSILRSGGEQEKILAVYPYLRKTYDQDQLSHFLATYFHNQKLIDFCQLPEETTQEIYGYQISPEQVRDELQKAPVDTWKDPYPVSQADIKSLAGFGKLSTKKRGKAEIDQLNAMLHLIPGYYSYADQLPYLGVYNLEIQQGNVIRKQPVQVELHFLSPLSGLIAGNVYVLTLRTPFSRDLSTFTNLKDELMDVNGDGKLDQEDLYTAYAQNRDRYPVVQFCKDSSLRISDYFRYHMKVDLPIITSNDSNRDHSFHNLDLGELRFGLEQLINCSDITEMSVFKKQDLDRQTLSIQMKSGNEKTHEYRSSPLTAIQTYTSIRNLSIDPQKVNLQQLLEWNHEYPLLEFAHDDQSNAIVVRAAYPDLRNESGESLMDEHERKTLKVWMDYVVESKFDS
jgi:superfamily II DNA or RNA helicase